MLGVEQFGMAGPERVSRGGLVLCGGCGAEQVRDS